MDQVLTALLAADQSAVIKTAIKISHLVGIVVGLGSATVLDLIIVRFLAIGKIDATHVAIVKFCSHLVTAGLVLLWLSGAAYLLHYWAFDPEKLGNAKVWAKIAIVGVLTINGVFIHARVLPVVAAQVGRGLFDGIPTRQRATLLFFGTVSATSWYVPLLLGATPQLNFVVSATSVLSTYAVLLLLALAATQGIAHSVWKRGASLDRQLEEQRQMLQRLAALMRAKDKPAATAPALEEGLRNTG